jgi:hypothetical protein
MRDWMTTLLPIVAVVAAVPLLAYCSQERLLFFPQPLSAEQHGALLRATPGVLSLDFEAADGTALHAWLLPARSAGPAPAVIYFGGNAENVAYMLGEVRRRSETRVRATTWLFVDYRGYGRSQGRPAETALVADALAAYDLLAARSDVDRARIHAFGRSLGSGVAVPLAAQRPLAGIVLVTPFDSAVAVGQRHYPFLPVGRLLKHRFDSLALAPAIKVPAAIIAAQRDSVVPPDHARRLADAWGGPVTWTLVRDAGHNDIDSAPAFWPAIEAALARAP